MTLLAVWKVLEEIIIEFRKKELPVPQKVMEDLRSAKVMINVADADEKGCAETDPKISEYLGNVEVHLVSEAQKSFPSETIDKWLKQLETASCIVTSQEEKIEPHFIPGLPRHQKWIRVKPLANLPLEKLESLAIESKLSFRTEEGQLLVYGNAGAVKEFIKKMTAQTSRH
jgi:hypothetical protein